MIEGCGKKKLAKMATCCLSEEDRAAVRRSREIDRNLQAEKKQYRSEIKILLLGAGESGKSTFLKQMRIIHGEDFDDEARIEFRPTVYHNVMKGAKTLAKAVRNLNIPMQHDGNEEFCDILNNYKSNILEPQDFVQYVEPLQALWEDSGIQTAFSRRNEFQLVRNTVIDNAGCCGCMVLSCLLWEQRIIVCFSF